MNELGRGWDVQDHPEWLVFEFEQGLQIRCIQNIVAQHLMTNPGAIAQLNMGEGKTRVILPMLILSMAKKDSLVRLHFLSPLLGEVYEYLHRHLTASVFLRKLFLVPFRRDVNLSEDDARRLYATLRRCMDSCGAICVAPEHRLSLELKFYELLAANKHTLCALLEKNQELPYVDIIDESDVILGHKLQLIYAVGSCMPLPDGNDRGVACEAVLWQLQSNAAVAEIVKISGLCRRVSKRGAGTFDDIRLIPGAALDLHRSALIEQIVNGIIDNPPYHMRWLRHIPFSREAVVKFVTDPSETWLTPVENESGVIWSQILALRGLLAHGIFENCLKARYRVDYGIDQRRGVKHRTAVPYRASDSPSERAEYKHPEMLLLRTILSYYQEGISRNEMKESVTSLLSHQSISQRLEYDLWFASARQTMSREQVNKLEDVAQLDVTNELQLDLLHEVYGYNMAAINFWLNNCVFPSETIQFPQSLIANAFHIANNSQGRVIGFSGTKDNHLLLPHQVEQSMRVHPELTATDGKMLDLLGPKNDQTVEVIDDSIDMSSGVLELAGRGYNSLIDAGGTMAGLSNRVVAMQMLDLLSLHGSALKGVVYFDVSENTWYIIDRRGRCLSKGSSPLHESEAFVYFDESRCRGADIKLSSDARAILTIGPGMCKDKLIQAAGRMRKLQYGQKITMAVPPELVSKILRMASNGNIGGSVTPMQILYWVLQNTIETVKEGLSEWGAQGIYFASSYNNSDARLVDETLDLERMYSASIQEKTILQILQDRHKNQLHRVSKRNVLLDSKSQLALHTVLDRAQQFGSDVKMKAISNEEECERELEEDRSSERVEERQIPRQKPAHPLKWLFSSCATGKIDPAAGVVLLKEAVRFRLKSDLSTINWDLCRIFVTQNFIETVITQHDTRLEDLSEYMRPVDAILVSRSGECLLVSEWEADNILEVLWEEHSSSCCVSMCSISYLLKAADSNWASPPELLVPSRSALDLATCFRPSEHTLAALNLFAGGTMFDTMPRRIAITDILQQYAGKRSALQLPTLRGRPHMITRSDLEDICTHTLN